MFPTTTRNFCPRVECYTHQSSYIVRSSIFTRVCDNTQPALLGPQLGIEPRNYWMYILTELLESLSTGVAGKQLTVHMHAYLLFLDVSLGMAADLSNGISANLLGVADTLQDGPHVGCLVTAISCWGHWGRWCYVWCVCVCAHMWLHQNVRGGYYKTCMKPQVEISHV